MCERKNELNYSWEDIIKKKKYFNYKGSSNKSDRCIEIERELAHTKNKEFNQDWDSEINKNIEYKF